MDRRLILAVAGSGKTTFLINTLDLGKRFLIVTYTDNNVAHIRRCIINRFGYMPGNISLMSYFQFLIHVCYRPFLKDKVSARGITWSIPDGWTRFKKNRQHYMTSQGFLYHNRISKLCIEEGCVGLIKTRIEKFYDYFMIDEVQDLGGHDFNLISSIIPTAIDCLFVGDFFQHTFDTSVDGNVNSGLYKDLKKYKRIWTKLGVTVDETTLSNSHRCTSAICNFVSQNLQINIASHKQDNSNIILIDNQIDADSLFNDESKVKLFFKEARKYQCYAENWGKSKGLDSFQDVCVVLNETTLNAYVGNNLHQLKPATLNKLYVACTRAKGNLFFIPHTFFDKYKQD